MEIEAQKKSLKKIVNGKKKLLRITIQIEAKESLVNKVEENLSVKNCMSLFLSDFTKDMVKVFGCHENFL